MSYEEAQGQTTSVQDQVDAGQSQETNAPVDLAEAFQMLRKNNQAPAQPPAEEGAGNSASQNDAVREQYVGEGDLGDSRQQPQVAAEPAIQEGSGDVGGSAASEPMYDYGAIRRGILEDIQRQAQQNVLRQFKENPSGEIKLMNIGDIYERQQDGTVVFHNPDDPRNPFHSRAEAQAWIDSMNNQIRQGYQKGVFEEQQRLLQLAQPAIRLMEFAPTYEAMDSMSQQIFDQLIEPYGVQNEYGKVVGYNCNLNAMAQQALNIVSNFAPRNQPAATAPAPSQVQAEPAMDMKTGASQEQNDREPKTIEEAWMMVNKQKKGN